MSLMFQPLKKYADFTGRARRSEYWLFTLFIILVEIAYFILVSAIGGGTSGNMNPIGFVLSGLYGLFVLGIIIPSLAVSFRRLHDTDRSAWWLLIAFLPFIGGLVLLVFNVLPGTNGPNKYGPDPKTGQTDTAAVFS
ncbi:DUF805 domain-containing protein [Caulobacter sp. BK020]|uniref:DUF805 domain-containing protein n=1 Tax=Caulobacter sp. BK020 TaxID=2512117 RepID=UPI00104C34CD|nr:DUF805 domain-containing protein [Caulobacter sp. BK020]TCS15032.1 uncharacterized membrane protein YhaH (DUF805 family) [Caulobacter sp. BK020]